MYKDVLYSTAISFNDILTALGCNTMIFPTSMQYVLYNYYAICNYVIYKYILYLHIFIYVYK